MSVIYRVVGVVEGLGIASTGDVERLLSDVDRGAVRVQLHRALKAGRLSKPKRGYWQAGVGDLLDEYARRHPLTSDERLADLHRKWREEVARHQSDPHWPYRNHRPH